MACPHSDSAIRYSSDKSKPSRKLAFTARWNLGRWNKEFSLYNICRVFLFFFKLSLDCDFWSLPSSPVLDLCSAIWIWITLWTPRRQVLFYLIYSLEPSTKDLDIRKNSDGGKYDSASTHSPSPFSHNAFFFSKSTMHPKIGNRSWLIRANPGFPLCLSCSLSKPPISEGI